VITTGDAAALRLRRFRLLASGIAGRGATRTATDPGTLREMTATRRRGTIYPEWDMHRRRCRPD